MTAAEETTELLERAESLMITLEMRIGKVVPSQLQPLYSRWLEANESAMVRGSSEEAVAASTTLLRELVEEMKKAGIKTL